MTVCSGDGCKKKRNKAYDCHFFPCRLPERLRPANLAWIPFHLKIFVAFRAAKPERLKKYPNVSFSFILAKDLDPRTRIACQGKNQYSKQTFESFLTNMIPWPG